MRRIKTRLAIACLCAVATALFTGAALAGNGKDNAPGQVKQDGTAAQPAAQVDLQADQSVSASTSDHVAPGQAKQETTATSTSSTQTSSRSEEHTSELQSRGQLVCRLLLEKKEVQAGGHAVGQLVVVVNVVE